MITKVKIVSDFFENEIDGNTSTFIFTIPIEFTNPDQMQKLRDDLYEAQERFRDVHRNQQPKQITSGNEKCPNCGSSEFAIARNMKSTRKCINCHTEWEPER